MIELNRVTHRVEVSPGTHLDAVRDVSLTIAEGEFVALMGANGSGKSTLVRHMNGLLLPTRGQVRVNGIDTADASRLWDVRQAVGLVFQNPDHQMVAPVVEEEVAFGPENLGLPVDEIRTRIDEALAAVDMQAFRRHNPGLLSGGQKQRIAIASILAMRPRFMVLDEPTAMLDAAGRREVLDILRRLNEDRGVAVILITHAMDEAVAARRLVVMRQGSVEADGPPHRIAGDLRELRRLELRPPPLVAALTSLVDVGFSLPQPLPLDVDEAARLVVAAARHISALPPRAPVPLSTPPSSTVEVSLEHVWYRYMQQTPFETTALRDVSIRLGSGERVAVVGGTGSGKSTLMQHFNGLLRATEGRVTVAGHDLSRPRPDLMAVRRHVGLVFQFPEHQLFEDTVSADVAYGPRNLGLAADEVDRRVRRACEMVGLDPDRYGARSPLALSGGEMRRVALAGVLAMEPRFLVMDEPAAGLDAEGQGRLAEIVGTVQAEGTTTAIVTHDIEMAMQLSDRLVVMAAGAVTGDGAAADVLASADASATVPPPACALLARALRAEGLPLGAAVMRPETFAQEVVSAVMKQGAE